MKERLTLGLIAMCLNAAAWGDFELWKDYDFATEVMSMTTVKVDAGKGDDYLEGLKQTWINASQVAKDLGQLEDFRIYTSLLPASGDFNVVLITTFKSLGDYAPDKDKDDAFMKEWGERRREMNDKIAETYPEMREIVGEYLLYRVNFK